MSLEPAVRAGGLLVPGRPVLVLFSGGADSTCLLDLAVRISGRGHVRALHVNYGLRDAADHDERHCRSVADALGVELTVRRPQRPAAGAGNLQAWAREARYAAAAELAAGEDIATGHTSSDQVETILYRLASSPSRRALLGMRPRNGALIRPLLEITRARTAAHCRERELPWVEDDTNLLDIYARGRVRARVIPALREVHPAAEANVLALMAILRDEAEVLDALVEEVLGGSDSIPLEAVRTLPPALRRLVVQRLADAALGRPAPGAARRADEVAAMAGRGCLDLPHGVRAVTENAILRFERTPPLGGRTGAASP